MTDQAKTKRKTLEERWQRYEFIANTSQELMALINQNRVYEAANDAYCRGHGKARKEIVGRTVAEVWGEERYLTRIKAVLDDSFAGREAHYPGWFEFARLGRRYFEVVYYPYRDNFDVVTHVVVVWRDETERQQAEEALQESLRQLKIAYDQATIYAQELKAEIRERKQIETELRRRTAQLETLRQIGLELTAELELNALLQSIATRAANLLNSISCGIFLYRPEKDELELVLAIGPIKWQVGTMLKRGEGVSGKIWQTGQSLIVDDYYNWSGRANTFKEYPTMAIVGAPIYWGRRFLGVLNVADQSRTFTPADAELLNLLATQAAIAIQNARLYTEINKRLKAQIALREATTLISASLDLKTVLSRIAEQMACAVDATSAYLCSYEPQAMTSTILAEYFGQRAADKERVSDLGITYDLPRDFTRDFDILQAGQPEQVYLNDLDRRKLEGSHMEQFGAQTILNIPLQIRGRIIAFAELWESQWRREFTTEELELCQALAQQAAVAIEHARLYSEARESEKKYRAVVNNVKEVIFQTDIVGRWTFLNPAWTEITGFTLEESLGHNLLDFIHPEDRERVETAFDLPFEPEIYYQHEARYLTKAGNFRWLDFRAMPVWDEQAYLLGAYGTLNDITGRRQAEDKLRAALTEKEVLLKEIHHRVKNNLQVISSLLGLQADFIHDPQALSAFADSQYRVKSMALVHEYLYQSENLAQIDFGEYLRHLIDDLLRLYGHRAGTVSVQINVSGPDTRGTDTTKVIWLDIHSAIPCGLIVQELVSNALKHAFPEGRAGQIWVELRADESELILRVCDDGVGLPKDMDFQYTESMGLQLVNMLTLQLKGNIELEQDSGTAFKLTLIRPVVQEGDLNDRSSSLSR